MTPKDLAYQKHQNQSYGKGDSIVPYVSHLEDVYNVLLRFGFTDYDLLSVAYLHDIIEDQDVSYNDLKNMFNLRIADIVFAVTDELGKNRKERKAKTYAKIRGNADAITIKLADRIANIEYGIKSKSDLVQMYKKEHADFRDALYISKIHDELWKYLDELLASLIMINGNFPV